jgi:hypothetical protein
MSDIRDRDRDCSEGNSLAPGVASSLTIMPGRRTDCGARSLNDASAPPGSDVRFPE